MAGQHLRMQIVAGLYVSHGKMCGIASQVATLAWRKQTALSWHAQPAQERSPVSKLLQDLQQPFGIYTIKQQLAVVADPQQQPQQPEAQHLPEVDHGLQANNAADHPLAQREVPGYAVRLKTS
jgi:hypothetical protein